jgi:exodeoxyribonuclease VII large subunit
VPVIASVGHHTDRTLLDEVAAVSCSTPTHAAESAVRCDVREAREGVARAAERLAHHGACAATARPELAQAAARLHQHGRRAVVVRARALVAAARMPAMHVRRERERLHQDLREIRAAGARRIEQERRLSGRAALVLGRKASATAGETVRADAALRTLARSLDRVGHDASAERRRTLDRLALALAAHDPQRTLERGYALVEDRAGAPLTTTSAARAAGALRVRFADGTIDTTVQEP